MSYVRNPRLVWIGQRRLDVTDFDFAHPLATLPARTVIGYNQSALRGSTDAESLGACVFVDLGK